MTERTVAVVQARLGSVRFPRKVLQPILDRPALEVLLARLARARTLDEIVLAVPEAPTDEPLRELASTLGLRCVSGSEHNVLDRYRQAARAAHAEVVVRITGDCPLIDPEVVDRVVLARRTTGADYACTTLSSFPDGLDTEVFRFDALERAWREATETAEREHVTPYLRTHPDLRRTTVDHPRNGSGIRLTLDEPADLEVIQTVFEHFGHDRFSLDDVLDLYGAHPELFAANAAIAPNQGASMGTGQKLWRRAQQVIPGGTMLLSKHPDMLLPAAWPTYFSRAQGCRIWDLDDNAYVDIGLMGVGTNILGYSHPAVDEAVRGVIDTGNMSTLNGPEEVLLAERLIELHPWAEMARFTRSGGEACAAAVRIARAASGRDGVAICGYHGWHDWYLAANLGESSALDGHLLPGLAPRGVPRALRGTVSPFAYNDLPSLERVLGSVEIGVIFMEPQRSIEPDPGFLAGVRALADRHDAVLVFDECTSGFRRALGGIHLHHGVDPDIAVLSKALGNGYPVSAVIGRRDVMEHAASTFISSTFWTERIGAAAGLATLEAMEHENAPERVDQIGRRVQDLWREIAARVGLAVTVDGLPALAQLALDGFDAAVTQTYLAQELHRQGFLGGTKLYACIAHEPELDHYAESIEELLTRIASLDAPEELERLLHGPVAGRGFARLA